MTENAKKQPVNYDAANKQSKLKSIGRINSIIKEQWLNWI